MSITIYDSSGVIGGPFVKGETISDRDSIVKMLDIGQSFLIGNSLYVKTNKNNKWKYICEHPQQTNMTLADMRTRFGGDANSIERVNYKTYVDATQAAKDVRIEVNETDTEVTRAVPAGYSDVDGNAITEVTLPPYSSQIILLL